MGNRSVEPNEEDLIRAWLDRHEIELRGPQPGRVERLGGGGSGVGLAGAVQQPQL